MKKQGLIAVDLDGTLIDTVAVNAESYRRALESFGFTLDYDYYAAYCNGRHYRAFLQPLMGGNPSAEDVERVHDLKKQGCDMAVLGCTELSLVKRDEHLGPFFIDSTEVLCRHALEACGVKPIGF